MKIDIDMMELLEAIEKHVKQYSHNSYEDECEKMVEIIIEASRNYQEASDLIIKKLSTRFGDKVLKNSLIENDIIKEDE